MRKIKVCFLLFALTCISFTLKADDPKIYREDLAMLLGDKWAGQLTYLGSASGKKISIRSDLTVMQSEADTNTWILKNEYPDDPSANSSDMVVISNDGKMLNGEMVRSRLLRADLTVEIVTEKTVQEKDTNIIIRYTYSISPKYFSIKKEDKNEDNIVFTQRNSFEYTR